MKFRRRHTRLTIIGLMIATLVLAACGNGAEDAPAPDPEPAEEPDEAAPAEEADDVADVEWPTRALEYVVPYNPGGSTDPIGREFSRLLEELTGQNVIVHNRAGADETIGISSYVVDEPGNSHIMGLTSATGIVVQPIVNPDIEYADENDWTNVVKMIEAPNAFLVRDDAPWETIEDLIEDARNRPGEISVGSTGRVTNNSFAVVGLMEQADIELNLVAFTGAGPAVTAVLGGQVDVAIPTISAQIGFLDAGELRSLGHTGDQVIPAAPDSVPLGTVGYDLPFSSDYFTIAPPDLDPGERDALIAAALEVANSDEFRQWCEDNGYIWDPTGPDEMSEWIANTTAASIAAIELINRMQIDEVDEDD